MLAIFAANQRQIIENNYRRIKFLNFQDSSIMKLEYNDFTHRVGRRFSYDL